MMHNVASSIRLDVFVNSYELCRYQVTNKRCLDISGRRFALTLTERLRESSRLRASESKQVSALWPLPSKRLRARAKTGQITCTYLELALPSVFPSMVIVAPCFDMKRCACPQPLLARSLLVSVLAKRLLLMPTHRSLATQYLGSCYQTSRQTFTVRLITNWPHYAWARCHNYKTESTLHNNRVLVMTYTAKTKWLF